VTVCVAYARNTRVKPVSLALGLIKVPDAFKKRRTRQKALISERASGIVSALARGTAAGRNIRPITLSRSVADVKASAAVFRRSLISLGFDSDLSARAEDFPSANSADDADCRAHGRIACLSAADRFQLTPRISRRRRQFPLTEANQSDTANRDAAISDRPTDRPTDRCHSAIGTAAYYYIIPRSALFDVVGPRIFIPTCRGFFRRKPSARTASTSTFSKWHV